MNIAVLLSSGDIDEWEGMHDTVEAENGSLLVVSTIDGDEVSGNFKTVVLTQEIDQGPDAPPYTKSDTYRVHAIYASGMWMKAEYY